MEKQIYQAFLDGGRILLGLVQEGTKFQLGCLVCLLGFVLFCCILGFFLLVGGGLPEFFPKGGCLAWLSSQDN